MPLKGNKVRRVLVGSIWPTTWQLTIWGGFALGLAFLGIAIIIVAIVVVWRKVLAISEDTSQLTKTVGKLNQKVTALESTMQTAKD